MSRLRLCLPRDTQQHNIFQFKEIATCTHVFLRRIAIAPPLTAPYDGPYKVVARSGRVMKIPVKGKVETVSLDRAYDRYEHTVYYAKQTTELEDYQDL